MSMKDLYKKAHDAVMTDDGETAAAAKTAPAKPTPALSPSWTPTTGPGAPYGAPLVGQVAYGTEFRVYGTPAPVLDEAVYQKVFEKTDFEKTPTAAVIHGYLDSMEDSPLDPNTKFKTALGMAKKRDGLTADKVLATFDQLRAALKAESDKFATSVNNMVAKEVTARQTQLQQIADMIAAAQKQIVAYQDQHTQVSAELADAQSHVSNATTQFGLATQRRSQEIDNQQVQFAALLK